MSNSSRLGLIVLGVATVCLLIACALLDTQAQPAQAAVAGVPPSHAVDCKPVIYWERCKGSLSPTQQETCVEDIRESITQFQCGPDGWTQTVIREFKRGDPEYIQERRK